ncbi:hypothetical protein BN80_019 [Yersinia phage phiR1-RT]|uniref:Uncharacterized protein n=3 Tax=Tegunavirus TaxID=1921704 RepID=A0A1V0DXB4_9CAUD|nr:hypothetical protein BN80_019 [Yersinia phage phiR1-RT]YP_009200280.1 hypothetical protein AVV33_gp019 [Yersinia phage vB_YenM_TG1]YP_010089600.1 hypothetical protein KNT60_gp020 [Yersinia phage fHe-Yen9-01]AJD81828.1 hypothetical protein YenMTG1_019 [Yersinia phage vB_YenM_TG1]ARB05794.1 hypothetical protein fHeYen901_21 [Yersinia phage fHe-Yen9-01]CCI88593.1 hypothetical protein BN80_019 [Yersinia phage phiR1-RT]
MQNNRVRVNSPKSKFHGMFGTIMCKTPKDNIFYVKLDDVKWTQKINYDNLIHVQHSLVVLVKGVVHEISDLTYAEAVLEKQTYPNGIIQ